MGFEIEKNIPIPDHRQNQSKNYFDVYSLEIGDSVFCSDAAKAGCIYIKLKRHGFNSTRRQVEGGFRVWRTK
tara:strand:+ start:3464 stop:3679 length:216 start_codon:yes stop_codon:yes gene_type:complete